MKKISRRTKPNSFFMKVVLIQSFLVFAFTTVTFAKEVHAQGILDKKISVTIKNESFKTVLRMIEKQAGIRFSYQRNTIPEKEKVSLSADDKTLASIFQILFQPWQIHYEALGNQVVLKKNRMLGLLINQNQMNDAGIEDNFKPIKGFIRNADGKAVSGASVIVKGTGKGTSTNANGNFEIDANEGDALVISAVGYEMTEFAVGKDVTVNIVLKQTQTKMEEVVIVGYGTQKKVNLTGSVSTITSKELDNRPVTNVSSALAGLASGVYVRQTSGTPGQRWS